MGLKPPTELRALAAAQQKAGVVPLGLLHYRFNLLDTLAVQNGLLSQPGGEGGALFDVAGRSQSPYLSRVLFLAAPETSVAATGDVRFVFAQNLHVQSGGGSVSNLSLDFGDGQGYQTAIACI